MQFTVNKKLTNRLCVLLLNVGFFNSKKDEFENHKQVKVGELHHGYNTFGIGKN